jgi:hypothetical protein
LSAQFPQLMDQRQAIELHQGNQNPWVIDEKACA